MKKVLIPSTILFMLAAGQVNAQLAGGDTTSDISNRNVSGAISTAPGNPNTSTVVPDYGGRAADTYSLPDTENFNSITPSAGNTNANNIYSIAPADMSLSQFTTYVRGRWGINGDRTITRSEWNNINPAFFDNNKPSFKSLDVNRNGRLNSNELRPIYKRMYQEYEVGPHSPPTPAQPP